MTKTRKLCGDCAFWKGMRKPRKRGECGAAYPAWVEPSTDSGDTTRNYGDRIASECDCFWSAANHDFACEAMRLGFETMQAMRKAVE